MAASLGELFVELGVFADTKELKEFEKKLQKVNKVIQDTGKKSNNLTQNIGNFIKKIRGVALAVTGAIYALNRLTDSLVHSNQELLNLTRTSDISLGTFQKWNNIGRMLGVKNAAQQLEGLNQRLFELMLTGEGARGFQLAGINPIGQSAEGVMEQLRNRVSGMSDTSASYLLQQMGLDPTMLHLLRMSREEFEALGRAVEKYQLTPEQRREIQRLNAQLEIARIKLQYIKDRAILALMPIMVRFTESLARVSEGIARIVKGVMDFLDRVPAIKAALLAIGAAFLIAFHPVIAILTALYLIIDDIMAYFNGGGSMLGVLLNFCDELGNKLKDISNIDGSELLSQLISLLSLLNSTALGASIGANAANLITPQSRINNSVTNNSDNRQVNQRISINTNQPALDIKNELYHANYAFA